MDGSGRPKLHAFFTNKRRSLKVQLWFGPYTDTTISKQGGLPVKNQSFERYEVKYLLDLRQQRAVLRAMAPHMTPDEYSHSSIRNLYLDTPDFRLIRHSLERPIYKEKLRIRSYGRAGADSPVFVELKKKYRAVVYKRRICLPRDEAARCLCGARPWPASQIGRELAYAMDFYAPLRPAVYLSYERDAYRGIEDTGFRVTFDRQIRYRCTDLTLDSDPWGTPILPEDRVLMEVKVPGGFPLWMAHALSEQGLFKTSFSKYGAAYRDMRLTAQKGERNHA